MHLRMLYCANITQNPLRNVMVNPNHLQKEYVSDSKPS